MYVAVTKTLQISQRILKDSDEKKVRWIFLSVKSVHGESYKIQYNIVTLVTNPFLKHINVKMVDIV